MEDRTSALIQYLMSSKNVLEAKATWGCGHCEVMFKVLPDEVTRHWLDGLRQRLGHLGFGDGGLLYRVGPIDFVLVGFGDPVLLVQQLESFPERMAG